MSASETADMATASIDPGDVPASNGIRRSTRARKVPSKYDEEYIIPSENPRQGNASRRADRPKRKAAEAAREQTVLEDVASLQEQIFARMDIDERKEYRGWVELESEPGFFNAMLQDLDAKSLKVQEVFALDEATLAALPQPVYGLIFLYEWTNEDESNEARQECPENLWFGNQTTANACATVALMNIIMNTHGIKLGPELEDFRSATKPLPPPHRGHALDTNDFIRAIHNSVARRVDLLSEDLLLDNKFQSAGNRRKTPPMKKKKKKKTCGPAKRDYEPGAYHYIALVPVDGQVWELDGLEAEPLCLGPYEPGAADAWLPVASSAIQRRMQRQDDPFPRFNLLAVCQSPLPALSAELAAALATASALGAHELWAGFTEDRLSCFHLTRESILTAASPTDASRPGDGDPETPAQVEARLRAELAALEARYEAEVASVDGAAEMIRARRRDYTPAVHQWVRVLAEKGVLRELMREMDSPD